MSQNDILGFLSSANADYIADVYAKYQKNPHGVDESWSVLFNGLGDEAKLLIAEFKGASWTPDPAKLSAVLSTPANTDDTAPKADKKSAKLAPVAPVGADVNQAVADAFKAFVLVRSWQVRGHLAANLDPLGLMERKYHPDLDPKTYGFTDADIC